MKRRPTAKGKEAMGEVQVGEEVAEEGGRSKRPRRVVDQTIRFNPGPEADNVDEEEDDDEKGKGAGCRCGRTKCLKQYCQCFRNDVRCSSECVCEDCHNDGKHEEKRIDAIRRIRMNNPNAFKGTDLEIEDQQVTTPRGSKKVIRGCRCKRSRCRKKYCECYGAGLECTTNCVCSDCQNGNDGGKIKSVAAIMKGHGPAQPRAACAASPEDEVDATPAAPPPRQRPAEKPRASSSVSVLPSQKHQPGRNQPQQQASQRPPYVQPQPQPTAASDASGANGGPLSAGGKKSGPLSAGGKKSFRRNDLKVGVPVPTYAPPVGDANGTSTRGSEIVVTPHGSIHLPTKPSPRGLMSPPFTGVAAPQPLPGASFRRDQSSPSMQWGHPSGRRSASPRWPAQNSPHALREESWAMDSAGGAFNMSDSYIPEQFSPLSGEMKSPTTRTRSNMLLNSARDSERGSPFAGLLPGGGGGAMAAMGGLASNGLQRRTSSNRGASSSGGLGSLSNLQPASPGLLVTDSSWGDLLDPNIESDPIFTEPGSARGWAGNMSGT